MTSSPTYQPVIAPWTSVQPILTGNTHTSGYGGAELLCPSCGGENTHIDTVGIRTCNGQEAWLHAAGEDEDASITLTGRDLKIPTGGHGQKSARRHSVHMDMHCEQCGHLFTVNFIQHKGTTYTTVLDTGVNWTAIAHEQDAPNTGIQVIVGEQR